MANLVKFFSVDEENGYMSNWWISNFVVNGMIFNCVEQYMMWRKAMLFGDIEVASNWDAIKESVVYTGCHAKFSQNAELREKLLSFDEDSIFVECSPNDSIWGIGLDASNTDSDDMSKWRGSNLLGMCIGMVYIQLLMES